MMRPVPSPLQLSRLSCHASLDPNSPQIYSKPQLRYCQQTTIPISLYFLRNKRVKNPPCLPRKAKDRQPRCVFLHLHIRKIGLPFLASSNMEPPAQTLHSSAKMSAMATLLPAPSTFQKKSTTIPGTLPFRPRISSKCLCVEELVSRSWCHWELVEGEGIGLSGRKLGHWT